MAPPYNPDSSWRKLLIFVVVVAGGYGGYRVYTHFAVGVGDALIDHLVLKGRIAHVTLVFSKRPAGDTGDVRLEIESEALTIPMRLDWKMMRKGQRKKLKAPPIGRPLRVKVLLPLKKHIRDPSGQTLQATLFWGGKKQDRKSGLWLKDPSPIRTTPYTQEELEDMVRLPGQYY